jgi:hypothetical protein
MDILKVKFKNPQGSDVEQGQKGGFENLCRRVVFVRIAI